MQTVLLVGRPNVGKSSLFNLLSGKYRKVSNYSGITVDRGVGEVLKVEESFEDNIRIIDLPGLYGIDPQSYDEGITVSSLLALDKDFFEYDKVAVILDFHQLQSSLVLALELRDVFGENCFFIVNKVDDKDEFTQEQCQKLQNLTGCQVLSFSVLRDKFEDLESFLRLILKKGERPKFLQKFRVTSDARDHIPEVWSSEFIEVVDQKARLDLVRRYTEQAREIINSLWEDANIKKIGMTEKIDSFILHPLWGSFVFFFVFYLIFHSVYTFAVPLMDGIDHLFVSLADLVGNYLADGPLKGLLLDGILAGVGGVVVFLPQIMILFFLLSLLEQSGYISRAAVWADRLMSFFGLSGKSFLPYLSGLACSVPAIMATRTISNKRERLATLVTIPFITCSARLPVYILLVGTFVPQSQVFGFLNSQALAFFLLYFLGSFFALLMAFVFRLSFFKGAGRSFFIDLPLYQRPSLKVAANHMLRKAKVFLKKAGTIILGLSIIIWFASTFPGADDSLTSGKSQNEIAAMNLENSYLGKIGKAATPILKPIGMDWKMGVGILVAFGARELFVSTLGTLYALGDVDEESSSLQERMKQEVDPVTLQPVYTSAVVWSILIFFVFALQCTSTLAIIYKETKHWKYPVGVFFYMGSMAYLGSFFVYHFLS